MRAHDYHNDALALLTEWGVAPGPFETWAFTDTATASRAYIHHSSQPAAVAAYAAVDPVFAKGRLHGLTLIDFVHKLPSMDGAELTALAMVSGSELPHFDGTRPQAFGAQLWHLIHEYDLTACFEQVAPWGGGVGAQFTMRPRGFDWTKPDQPALPHVFSGMRKAYRAMEPVRQILVVSILHLYLQRTDKHFLIGGCPTRWHAADAIEILRANDALSAWGRLVSLYAGW